LVILALGIVTRDTVRPRISLLPAAFEELRGWSADRMADALQAFLSSCAVISERSDGAAFDPASHDFDFGRVADWRGACTGAVFIKPGDDDAAHRFFTANFVPVLVQDNADNLDPQLGLFTGYYEVQIDGSLHRHGRYQIPLYRRPANPMVTTRYARADIAAGASQGLSLAVLWLAHPTDAYLLSMQGSGVVRLDDGNTLRIGYAGQNGHPYVPIAQSLLEAEAIAPRNILKAPIREKRRKLTAALHDADAPYVYFHVVHRDGPVGAEGVVLTPGRSLAIDRAYIALGVPLWLEAEERFSPQTKIRRLVVAQDVGGAIKGPVRGDLFWGTGSAAGVRASAMNACGRYYLLLPPRVAARLTLGAD
jgi:membrane-bound lytic murein transglycosylase A